MFNPNWICDVQIFPVAVAPQDKKKYFVVGEKVGVPEIRSGRVCVQNL
jgi:hypothetical protein